MIFYFSATGNSQYAAQQLAMPGEELVSIGAALREDRLEYETQDERVGFVVPVYYLGIPIPLKEFAARLNLTAPRLQYKYLVLTCGGSTGTAGRMGSACLVGAQLAPDGVFSVKMPDNFSLMYKVPEQSAVEQLLDNARQELEVIGRRISECAPGDHDLHKGRLPRLLTAVVYPAYKDGGKTARFSVDGACVSCGRCESVCPAGTIELFNGKPEWKTSRCYFCLACLHSCPHNAIICGRSKSNGQYKNPRVRLLK